MTDNYQAVYDAVRSKFNGFDTSQALESAIANAFSNAYVIPEVVRSCMSDVANEMMRPFVLLRPKVYPDGDQWCALYGDDLQSGVCAFGETPEKASVQFDIEWLNQKAKYTQKNEIFPGTYAALDKLSIRSGIDYNSNPLLREFRYKGYKGEPISKGATEEQIAAWNDGLNAREK